MTAAMGITVRVRLFAVQRELAGTRDVSKVELSFDDGGTWTEVSEYAYDGNTMEWKFWSYTWRPTEVGDHILAVRAYDGTGALQELERRASHPREGVTGMHRVRATVVA